MLAKVFAVVLLTLAASPLTQPFSTFSLGELMDGALAQRRSTDTVTATAAVHVASDTSFPDNLPVDVRPLERHDRRARVAFTPCVSVDTWTTAALAAAPAGSRHHQPPQPQFPQSARMGAYAVLRL
jgi:hypothetical protein